MFRIQDRKDIIENSQGLRPGRNSLVRIHNCNSSLSCPARLPGPESRDGRPAKARGRKGRVGPNAPAQAVRRGIERRITRNSVQRRTYRTTCESTAARLYYREPSGRRSARRTASESAGLRGPDLKLGRCCEPAPQVVTIRAGERPRCGRGVGHHESCQARSMKHSRAYS